MECPLGAAEAARALKLTPSARCRPKSSEASRRTRRIAPALDEPTGAQAPAGTHRAERKSEIAGIAAYPTSDTEMHAAGQFGDWIRQHSPKLGNAALLRVGCALPQPVRHNASQGKAGRRAAMFCVRKALSRKSTITPGQPSCRTGMRASGPLHEQGLSDFPILPSHVGSQSVDPLASGDVGSPATTADYREFHSAKRIFFDPRRNCEEPLGPSNRILSQTSFGEKQQTSALRCMKRRIATRPSCAAIATSRKRRAEFNSSRKEKDRIKMRTTCRGIRCQTTLERTDRRRATIPDYSTQQVRRIADVVLGNDVSGEEVSAILLALIVDPCDPCAFSSNSTEFRHGPSACGSTAEAALSLANSEYSPSMCDMQRSLRRKAAHSTCKCHESNGDIPAIFKTALKEQAGTRDLPELPSCSCPARTPNPRRNFRSGRTSRHIIPIVNSGSANSRTGYPKCASTYRRHAFNRAAMRVLSPGGITLSFRKRRIGHSTRNGSPPLVQQTERKLHDN